MLQALCVTMIDPCSSSSGLKETIYVYEYILSKLKFLLRISPVCVLLLFSGVEVDSSLGVGQFEARHKQQKVEDSNSENISLFHTNALSTSTTTHDALNYEDSLCTTTSVRYQVLPLFVCHVCTLLF